MQIDSIENKFKEANLQRNQLSGISHDLLDKINYMDYNIRKQLKSFSLMVICGGNQKTFRIDKKYQRAFKSLNLHEKVDEYCRTIRTIAAVINDLSNGKQMVQNLQEIELRLVIFMKKQKQIGLKIRDFKVCSTEDNSFNIDLQNYLLRKSKKKDHNWYVLEPFRKPNLETIRFRFLDPNHQFKYLPMIQNRINHSQYLEIYEHMRQITNIKKGPNFKKIHTQFELKQQELETTEKLKIMTQKEEVESLGPQSNFNQSICEDLVKNLEEQDLREQLSEYNEQRNESMQKKKIIQRESASPKNKKKYSKNIFRILMPSYEIKFLSSIIYFSSVYHSPKSSFFIYHHTKSHNLFKLKMDVNLSLQDTIRALYNVHLYKNWHPQVKEGHIKMNITCENSCILYQLHQPFNQWYRCRDFIILTHLFKYEQNYYIAQKSIEHSSFVPFNSITRGSFEYMLWKIEPKEQQFCKVTAQLKIIYQGMLNRSHQKDLTIRYLKGFVNMEQYFIQIGNICKLATNMSMNWEVTQNYFFQHSLTSVQDDDFQTVDFEDGPSQISQEDQIFYSIQDLSDNDEEAKSQKQESQHEIEQVLSQDQSSVKKNIKSKQDQLGAFDPYRKQEIIYDEQGLIVLPQTYLKKHFIMEPFQTEIVRVNYPNNNIVLKNLWQVKKTGALKLICKKKIQAQNNVFSFIMKTMRKNLMSGKGILNISLPVQIFHCDSNIQRLCTSMSLGPHFLEKAVSEMDPIQRLYQCLSFGFSNSIIFLEVDKPFNPILGETYQGFIRGCPIYAEQISHHPPISSLYFVGRGYKVYGSLEGKVFVHLNSGEGVNWGFYHIVFDDGEELLYQSPGGQITGLSYGDRGYNFKGKAYILDMKNDLYGEIRFQDNGGFFGKNKLEYDDEFKGQVYKVKKEFFNKFIKSDKRSGPTDKQIIEKKCEISGRWPYTLEFNKKVYYNIIEDLPDVLTDEPYPLHSNSLYREDLQYRSIEDLGKSQREKQRLQILQRKDRKLRQQLWGKDH